MKTSVTSCLVLWYLAAVASTHAAKWKWEKDFVAVVVSTTNRMALTHSTRCWRLGMRTIIATNASDAEAQELTRLNKAHNEVYVPVADEIRESADRAHAKRSGDVRAALLPSLAHQLLKGDYSWMLYADDDTLFYPLAMVRMLEDLDPEQPMAISDNIWLSQLHPNINAPRCTPCKPGSSGTSTAPAKADHYVPPQGCPSCSPSIACKYYEERGEKCRWSGAHGGAGVVMSRGLMNRIPHADMVKCIGHQWGCSGGDCLLSRCLWLKFNTTYTDPGFTVLHNSADYVVFDNPKARDALRSPVERLITGRCDPLCRWSIQNAVSLHIGARLMPSLDHAAAALRALCGAHKVALDFLDHMAELKGGANISTDWGKRRRVPVTGGRLGTL